MSIKDKVANAEPTDWLTRGLTEAEVKKIEEEALADAEAQLSADE